MSLLFQCAKVDLEEDLLELFLLNYFFQPVGVALGAPTILIVPRGRKRVVLAGHDDALVAHHLQEEPLTEQRRQT
jgi:hypothetical protein